MAKKFDIRLNPPKTKADLTKDNMKDFIAKYATIEQTEQYIALVAKCKVVRANNLTKETGEITDIQALRAGFIKLFPEFAYLDKKKSEKEKESPTYEGDLAEILAKKKAGK